MNKRLARWTLTVPLVAVVACSSQGNQDENMPAPEAPVVQHTYSIASGEFIRVPLEGGATYRATLDDTGIRLEVRPVEASVQEPRVLPFLPGGASASGTSTYTISPNSDAVYEIRSIGGDPARPTTLTLVRETDRKPKDQATDGQRR